MLKTINLNNIDTVRKFITMTSMIEEDVTIYSERYIVDGKSIMGLFSLDLSRDIEVEFPDEYESRFEEFEV